MKRSRLAILIATMAAVLSLLLAGWPQPCLADVNISLDQYSGTVGTKVTVSGAGFSSSVTVASITLSSGINSATAPLIQTSNSNGYFTAYFTVPALPKNSYAVAFTPGTASSASTSNNGTATAPHFFIIDPSVSLDTTSGLAGDQISVNGNGFTASPSRITVSIDKSQDALGSVVATATGTFTGLKVTIPDVMVGSHSIVATDSSGNTASGTFTVRPKITVTPQSIVSGSQVTISGKGFADWSPLSFTLDGISASLATKTNEVGKFTDVVFPIPAIPSGAHVLKVTDAKGNSDSSPFSTTQTMQIAPQTGQVGSRVTIKGTGFGAGKNIAFTFKSQEIVTDPGNVISDKSGNFSAAIMVPPSTAGIYAIAAGDGITTSSTNFTLVITVKLDQPSGASGSTVPISGSGFSAASNITVKYDGTLLATTRTDADGTFTTSFKVPSGPSGQHKITVSDGAIPVALSFASTAFAQLSNASGSGIQINGNIGSEVKMSGNAYIPGAALTVTYDATRVATGSVNNDGSFSVSFKVPVSQAGKHSVISSDGTNSTTCTFVVDSTPPPAPEVVGPAHGSRLGAAPKFQWTQMRSPNGVTYNLQIAQDPGFNTIVLNKTDLTINDYQLGKSEKLKSTSEDKPYYWRVRTVDGASNESSWSTASTFSVGIVWPSWLPYVIYAVAGLVIFSGGFFLGSQFEFDPSQLPKLNPFPYIKELPSKIGELVSGRLNFGFMKKILKKG